MWEYGLLAKQKQKKAQKEGVSEGRQIARTRKGEEERDIFLVDFAI